MRVPSYTYNSSNELTSTSAASYTYDNNGNTLSKTVSGNTTQYAWDFENRLTSVTLPGTGGTATFKDDPFGRRIQKVFTQGSTKTTNYVYDGVNSIEEVDQNGNVLARYTQSPGVDEPLSELRSGTASFYDQDGLGSVSSLSSTGGALANTYTYDSFGNLVASSGTITNPYQYTGRDYDAETGLRYYRARYYDTGSGRFLNEDPLGFDGGNNFYNYVNSNPINWIDPTGLAMSREECKRLLKQIKAMSYALAAELAKYNPITDGFGGFPMKWGTGATKPGGHYREMANYAAGIANRAAVYWKNCRKCDGNPSLPESVWNPVKEFNKAPRPVIPFQPITDGELEMLRQAARYRQDFWQWITVGDIALFVVGTGGAAGGFSGAASGAGGLVPAFGW